MSVKTVLTAYYEKALWNNFDLEGQTASRELDLALGIYFFDWLVFVYIYKLHAYWYTFEDIVSLCEVMSSTIWNMVVPDKAE